MSPQQHYDNAQKFLRLARAELTSLAVIFEEDENGHDMSTVEDLHDRVKELIDDMEVPANLFISTEIS